MDKPEALRLADWIEGDIPGTYRQREHRMDRKARIVAGKE